MITSMHRSSCISSPVLALLIAPLAALAQSSSLPPIFEKVGEPSAAKGVSHFTPSLLSDRVRGLISDRVLADSGLFGAAGGPVSFAPVAMPTDNDAVVMKQFVVKSSSLRLIELPKADTAFLRFVKTGTLYRHVGRKIETQISLNFLPVVSDGYGNSQASTRAELRFSFRW